MKYRVLRNCYGFQGRYWKRDDIVDLDPKSNPPIHFKPLSDYVDAPVAAPKPVVKPVVKHFVSAKPLIAVKPVVKAPTVVKAHPKPK